MITKNTLTKGGISFTLVRYTALLLALLVVGLGAYLYGRSQSSSDIPAEGSSEAASLPGAPAEDTEAVSLYVEALRAVEGYYVDQDALDSKEQTYGAIEGMLASLDDDHMSFETPEEVEQNRERYSEESPTVFWNPIPSTNVAHLRLTHFYDRSASELEEAISKAQQVGAERFVLDLRDNRGGWVGQAEEIAARFLPARSLVYIQRDATMKEEEITVPEDKEPLNAPLVVLVYGGSASSAEILAGALRDNDQAKVVGETTIGAGTLLHEYPLSDNSAILLADAEWLTPKGNTIQEAGITPDVEARLEEGQSPLSSDEVVGLSKEQIFAEDSQLRVAYEVLQRQ